MGRRVKTPIEAGVYSIVCVPTGHTYIGASANLHERRKYHWAFIRHGSHIDKTMRSLCEEFGAAAMNWSILERVDLAAPGVDERLREAEARWMLTERRRLGELLVNNPNHTYRCKSRRGQTVGALLKKFNAFCDERGVIATDELRKVLTAYMQSAN